MKNNKPIITRDSLGRSWLNCLACAKRTPAWGVSNLDGSRTCNKCGRVHTIEELKEVTK